MNWSTIWINVIAAVIFLLLGVLFTYLVKLASVSNLDSNGENVGLEHFVGKHYLVIEPLSEGRRQVSVLTLPDLSQPRKIMHQPGWGSLQFSFKLQNGVLTEFGSTQDLKGPETLAAVGATMGTSEAPKVADEVLLYEIQSRDGGIQFNKVSLP